MKKFVVNCAIPVHMNIEVEAEDGDAAIEAAYEYMGLTGYAGNGGCNKLVGTAESNVSIEAGDQPLEGNGWEITVEPA